MRRKTPKDNADSSRANIWLPPGLPWELEVLTLLLVAASFVLPLFLFPDVATEQEALMPEDFTPNMLNILWLFAIIGTYFAHIAGISTQVTYCTTPPNNFFAPLFFGLLCYGNLYYLAKERDIVLSGVTGEWHQLIGYPMLIFGTCLLLARLRTLRHLHRFRNVTWKLTSLPQLDRSFIFDLGRAILPIFYLPRRYRFSEEGILVEGFHYLYAISFRSIESVEPAVQFSSLTSATYYSGSSKHTIQIQANDHPTPIMISPQDIEESLAFCEQHALEQLVVSKHKSRSTSKAGETRRIQSVEPDS